jgi:signal transduction histidine kinase
VDLSALAGEAVTLLRLAEPQRRVHVEIEPGLACRGDAALLRDLLAELLANAWQSGHGRPAPWVRMGRVEGAPQRFFVSDNGCGFEAAEQARLFLPFERGATVRGERSPGLGLALARAIVGRHHGRLWAESLPGRGSTFYFELSAMPAEEGPPQVREVVIDVADDWPHAPTGT